ncbi:MAG: DUF1579 domain-containing protein [Verrucomicrobiota bacterium]
MKAAPYFFNTMLGDWNGTCRTWFQPGKLADESEISGKIRRVIGGGYLRHEYSGEIQGKMRHGDEIYLFNTAKNRFEVSWIVSFHMSDAIMLSMGNALPANNGFEVVGSYDAGPGNPPWGWKTVYEIIDAGHLKITAFNITPNGEEAKAGEIEYKRES